MRVYLKVSPGRRWASRSSNAVTGVGLSALPDGKRKAPGSLKPAQGRDQMCFLRRWWCGLGRTEGWARGGRGVLASRESSMDIHFHSLPQSLGLPSPPPKIENSMCGQLKLPFHKLTGSGMLLLKWYCSLKQSVLG